MKLRKGGAPRNICLRSHAWLRTISHRAGACMLNRVLLVCFKTKVVIAIDRIHKPQISCFKLSLARDAGEKIDLIFSHPPVRAGRKAGLAS